MTADDNGRRQPAPWSTPGIWTITTVNGFAASGYLPDWAEDDPSEVDVPMDALSMRLTEIGHRVLYDGQMVNIATMPSAQEVEEEAVFEAAIDCNPYSPDPVQREPVVNIHVVPGRWIPGLDPAGVAAVAAKLHAQADLLTAVVRPALIAAREDWAAHHPGRS
ncbi:DUF6907 domain-containing protein [Streptomyces sp. CBMA29]|uniref:DUF6907 domain-containing protein n=1 Tax=Streptomyces sp. CBMA29 TaxID=1896314 RepID=UPI001661E167|nr:hypothetical protein [Streptomyces sp. CBMA29]MBD0737812.1 hypothetical protein [Streptomyces sp. CBMA29]